MRHSYSTDRSIRHYTLGVLAMSALAASPAYAAEPEVQFHGQYRINTYMDVQDSEVSSLAARIRLRPTFDVDFEERVQLHLQQNIGHITANMGNGTLEQSGGPAFGIRHGYIRHHASDAFVTTAGIVPLSDKCGDTLFSGDWDFNPLAVVLDGAEGKFGWRAGAGLLQQNSESASDDDNMTIAMLDLDLSNFGLSAYWFTAGEGAGTATSLDGASLFVVGPRYGGSVGALELNAFVLVSALTANAGNQDLNSTGFAAKVEAALPVEDKFRPALMVLYASGDEDFGSEDGAGAFITPMSLAGHHGYWGYTGKLTIQGPTDTGIDDPINIDGGSYGNQNLGGGLLTVQAKVDGSLTDFAKGYLGIGMFQAAAADDSVDIGFDGYGQVTFQLAPHLGLDVGADFASLGEGHHGATSAGRTTVLTAASRLQLEW